MHHLRDLKKEAKEAADKAESEAKKATREARPNFMKRLGYQFHETSNQKNRKSKAEAMQEKSSKANEEYKRLTSELQQAVGYWTGLVNYC